MKHTLKLTAAVAALLLAGCASLQPAYHRPAVTLGAYPTGAAYRPDPQGTAQPDAADIGWRDFLREPRLQRLVELALANNRDLRIAALNVEKVRAQYRLQRSSLFPQIGLSAGADASRSLSSGAMKTAQVDSAGFAAAWEPDFFGRLHSLSDAALQEYLASSYARRATAILLVGQVATQDLTLRADDELLKLTGETLDDANAALKLIKLQYDTGTASELDLRLAETSVEQAEANQATQLRQRAQAENALRLLIAGPLPADLPAPLPLANDTMVSDVRTGLPSDLLERRPDIQQAEAQLRAENANIGAARAAFFPNISLTGSVGSVSPALGGLFAAGTGAWSFMPALTAPLFDGGANRANLDVALLERDIGVAQYEKAVRSAFREVSDQLAARGTYDRQLDALRRYSATEQRRLDLAEMRYKSGVDDYLSVLSGRTDLYNVRQAEIVARLNRLSSRIDLYRALGGWRAGT